MDIRSYLSSSTESSDCLSTTHTAEDETESDGPSASKKVCRRYNSKWEQDFSWLEFNEDVQGAFCKLCKKWAKESKHRSRGVWTTEPFTNWRKATEKMRTHERGMMHKTASRVAVESEMSERQGSVAQQLRQIANEERMRNRKCIQSFIRCTHFLVCHHIPHTTNYDGLIQLVLDCGVPHLAQFLENASKNATYRSTKSVIEFVGAISTWIDELLLRRLRNAPYYSVMLDECTDVTVVEEMSVFFRWTEKGEPVEHFFDVLPLKEANAESITTVLMDYLVKKELSLSHLVGMGFDGAATFSGRVNGVQSRIKKHSPFAVYVHCHCHQLQLACIQAANETPGIEHVYTTISSLWKFFHYSPKRSQSLKEIQTVLELPELKIIKLSDTRWLSHERCIKAIKVSYNALVTTLEKIYHESHLPEALGLSKALSKKSTICAIFLLDEGLPQVSKLSKALQAVKIDLSDVPVLVEATLCTLSDCKHSAANWVLQLVDICDEIETTEESSLLLMTLVNFRRELVTALSIS